MKKTFWLLISVVIFFQLSITAFADNTSKKYFTYSPESNKSYELISAYSTEKKFDGIIFDCRGNDYSDYIKTVSKVSDDLEHMIIVDPQDVSNYVTLLKKNSFFSTIILSSFSGQSQTIIQEQLDINIGIFLPFQSNYLFEENVDYNSYDLILFENNYSSYGNIGFEQYLHEISSYFANSRVIPYCNLNRVQSPVISGDFFGDAFEISNQFLICKLNGTDFCVSDYEALISNKYNSSDNLYSIMESSNLDENANFSISDKFEITRPTTPKLVVDTYYYTIFGTSDPNKELYLNGKEVERIGSSGLFAETVEVPKKGETFTFSQNGINKSVFISRTPSGNGNGNNTISKIKSCKPSDHTIIHYGETIKLSCIAPGQAKVSAIIDGQKIELKQIAYTDSGIPATYSAEFVFTGSENYPNDEVTLAGKVQYYLSYNGNKSQSESNGNIYVAGENAKLVIKATTDMAGVEKEPIKSGHYITTLRKGCRDYVIEEKDGWYLLSCGGYINSDHSEFVTGNAAVENTVSQIQKEENTNYAKVILDCSSLPAFQGDIYGNKLKITLFNTKCSIDDSSFNNSSSLINNVFFEEMENGSTELTIDSLQDLWGWDVVTNEETNKLTIIIKTFPKLSNNQRKPLSGVNITVCAGHGGIDPGALSVAGTYGVNEAQINRANALTIGETLENLGANVQYLICESGKMDTYDRTDPARESLCDVYICCHANSVSENAEANKWCGTAVYYHYDSSALFSSKLCDYISLATNRDNEGSISDYYSVTRLTLCPAVMMEVGFVSNPKEFESLIDPRDIQKTAFAVTKAVLEICDN